MDYNEIKEKYSKAFEHLINWCFLNGEHTGSIVDRAAKILDGIGNPRIKHRDLYDFFDENDIRIFPLNTYDQFGKNTFGYEIWYDIYRIANNQACKIRKQAEEAAFIKAFEILEEKLNYGKNN